MEKIAAHVGGDGLGRSDIASHTVMGFLQYFSGQRIPPLNREPIIALTANQIQLQRSIEEELRKKEGKEFKLYKSGNKATRSFSKEVQDFLWIFW